MSSNVAMPSAIWPELEFNKCDPASMGRKLRETVLPYFAHLLGDEAKDDNAEALQSANAKWKKIIDTLKNRANISSGMAANIITAYTHSLNLTGKGDGTLKATIDKKIKQGVLLDELYASFLHEQRVTLEIVAYIFRWKFMAAHPYREAMQDFAQQRIQNSPMHLKIISKIKSLSSSSGNDSGQGFSATSSWADHRILMQGQLLEILFLKFYYEDAAGDRDGAISVPQMMKLIDLCKHIHFGMQDTSALSTKGRFGVLRVRNLAVFLLLCILRLNKLKTDNIHSHPYYSDEKTAKNMVEALAKITKLYPDASPALFGSFLVYGNIQDMKQTRKQAVFTKERQQFLENKVYMLLQISRDDPFGKLCAYLNQMKEIPTTGKSDPNRILYQSLSKEFLSALFNSPLYNYIKNVPVYHRSIGRLFRAAMEDNPKLCQGLLLESKDDPSMLAYRKDICPMLYESANDYPNRNAELLNLLTTLTGQRPTINYQTINFRNREQILARLRKCSEIVHRHVKALPFVVVVDAGIVNVSGGRGYLKANLDRLGLWIPVKTEVKLLPIPGSLRRVLSSTAQSQKRLVVQIADVRRGSKNGYRKLCITDGENYTDALLDPRYEYLVSSKQIRRSSTALVTITLPLGTEAGPQDWMVIVKMELLHPSFEDEKQSQFYCDRSLSPLVKPQPQNKSFPNELKIMVKPQEQNLSFQPIDFLLRRLHFLIWRENATPPVSQLSGKGKDSQTAANAKRRQLWEEVEAIVHFFAAMSQNSGGDTHYGAANLITKPIELPHHPIATLLRLLCNLAASYSRKKEILADMAVSKGAGKTTAAGMDDAMELGGTSSSISGMSTSVSSISEIISSVLVCLVTTADPKTATTTASAKESAYSSASSCAGWSLLHANIDELTRQMHLVFAGLEDMSLIKVLRVLSAHVEAKEAKYPGTRGILEMLLKLFPHEWRYSRLPRTNICAAFGATMPDMLRGICSSVFVVYDSWRYRDRIERWNIGTSVLRIFDVVLNNPNLSQDLRTEGLSRAAPLARNGAGAADDTSARRGGLGSGSQNAYSSSNKASSLGPSSGSLKTHLLHSFMTEGKMRLALVKPIVYGLAIIESLQREGNKGEEVVFQKLLIWSFKVLRKVISLARKISGSKPWIFVQSLMESPHTVGGEETPSVVYCIINLLKRRVYRFKVKKEALETLSLLAEAGISSSNSGVSVGTGRFSLMSYVGRQLEVLQDSCKKMLKPRKNDSKISTLKFLANALMYQPVLAERLLNLKDSTKAKSKKESNMLDRIMAILFEASSDSQRQHTGDDAKENVKVELEKEELLAHALEILYFLWCSKIWITTKKETTHELGDGFKAAALGDSKDDEKKHDGEKAEADSGPPEKLIRLHVSELIIQRYKGKIWDSMKNIFQLPSPPPPEFSSDEEGKGMSIDKKGEEGPDSLETFRARQAKKLRRLSRKSRRFFFRMKQRAFIFQILIVEHHHRNRKLSSLSGGFKDREMIQNIGKDQLKALVHFCLSKVALGQDYGDSTSGDAKAPSVRQCMLDRVFDEKIEKEFRRLSLRHRVNFAALCAGDSPLEGKWRVNWCTKAFLPTKEQTERGDLRGMQRSLCLFRGLAEKSNNNHLITVSREWLVSSWRMFLESAVRLGPQSSSTSSSVYSSLDEPRVILKRIVVLLQERLKTRAGLEMPACGELARSCMLLVYALCPISAGMASRAVPGEPPGIGWWQFHRDRRERKNSKPRRLETMTEFHAKELISELSLCLQSIFNWQLKPILDLSSPVNVSYSYAEEDSAAAKDPEEQASDWRQELADSLREKAQISKRTPYDSASSPWSGGNLPSFPPHPSHHRHPPAKYYYRNDLQRVGRERHELEQWEMENDAGEGVFYPGQSLEGEDGARVGAAGRRRMRARKPAGINASASSSSSATNSSGGGNSAPEEAHDVQLSKDSVGVSVTRLIQISLLVLIQYLKADEQRQRMKARTRGDPSQDGGEGGGGGGGGVGEDEIPHISLPPSKGARPRSSAPSSADERAEEKMFASLRALLPIISKCSKIGGLEKSSVHLLTSLVHPPEMGRETSISTKRRVVSFNLRMLSFDKVTWLGRIDERRQTAPAPPGLDMHRFGGEFEREKSSILRKCRDVLALIQKHESLHLTQIIRQWTKGATNAGQNDGGRSEQRVSFMLGVLKAAVGRGMEEVEYANSLPELKAKKRRLMHSAEQSTDPKEEREIKEELQKAASALEYAEKRASVAGALRVALQESAGKATSIAQFRQMTVRRAEEYRRTFGREPYSALSALDQRGGTLRSMLALFARAKDPWISLGIVQYFTEIARDSSDGAEALVGAGLVAFIRHHPIMSQANSTLPESLGDISLSNTVTHDTSRIMTRDVSVFVVYFHRRLLTGLLKASVLPPRDKAMYSENKRGFAGMAADDMLSQRTAWASKRGGDSIHVRERNWEKFIQSFVGGRLDLREVSESMRKTAQKIDPKLRRVKVTLGDLEEISATTRLLYEMERARIFSAISDISIARSLRSAQALLVSFLAAVLYSNYKFISMAVLPISRDERRSAGKRFQMQNTSDIINNMISRSGSASSSSSTSSPLTMRRSSSTTSPHSSSFLLRSPGHLQQQALTPGPRTPGALYTPSPGAGGFLSYSGDTSPSNEEGKHRGKKRGDELFYQNAERVLKQILKNSLSHIATLAAPQPGGSIPLFGPCFSRETGLHGGVGQGVGSDGTNINAADGAGAKLMALSESANADVGRASSSFLSRQSSGPSSSFSSFFALPVHILTLKEALVRGCFEHIKKAKEEHKKMRRRAASDGNLAPHEGKGGRRKWKVSEEWYESLLKDEVMVLEMALYILTRHVQVYTHKARTEILQRITGDPRVMRKIEQKIRGEIVQKYKRWDIPHDEMNAKIRVEVEERVKAAYPAAIKADYPRIIDEIKDLVVGKMFKLLNDNGAGDFRQHESVPENMRFVQKLLRDLSGVKNLVVNTANRQRMGTPGIQRKLNYGNEDEKLKAMMAMQKGGGGPYPY